MSPESFIAVKNAPRAIHVTLCSTTALARRKMISPAGSKLLNLLSTSVSGVIIQLLRQIERGQYFSWPEVIHRVRLTSLVNKRGKKCPQKNSTDRSGSISDRPERTGANGTWFPTGWPHRRPSPRWASSRRAQRRPAAAAVGGAPAAGAGGAATRPDAARPPRTPDTAACVRVLD